MCCEMFGCECVCVCVHVQMGVASDKEGELVQVKAENVSLQVTLTELQDK